MRSRQFVLMLGLGLGFAFQATFARLSAQAQGLVEPPILRQAVSSGILPAMADRLPTTPRRINLAAMQREPGVYGGEIRLLMADQRDLRMMTIYGYARLVVFDAQQELVPDILERVEVSEGRSFTLVLRDGHRWSDGQPFSTEDFRYWWEDVANNKRLSPGGPPLVMMPDGKPPVFEVLDKRTVRYTWPVPNPSFLPALAGAQPLYIQMPAHYMRQFHERHADPATLPTLVRAARVRDWGALHEQRSRQYRPENPDLPTLDPWRNRTAPPAQRFVFERNPFFHRSDERGQQLPYIDRVVINTATAQLIPAKTGAGDTDLQARYLRFENYTFLKAAAKRQGFDVKLWRRADGANLAIYPNLNTTDQGWRALLRDKRVRQAFSVAINRKDINSVIFYGLAKEGANTLIDGSPLHDPAFQKAFAQHDPALANRLLDEAGLIKRDWDGVRLLPDGRRAEITIESAADSTEETDSIELIIENFRAVGIRLFSRASQRDLFRRRLLIGDTMMSMSTGLDNGIAGPDTEPDALAPTSPAQYQWPAFGAHVESRGKDGTAIDMPEVAELSDLLKTWRHSISSEERRVVWRKMLAIHAEQVFSIGLINSTLQPVVASQRLRNVPAKGWFSFEPGAFFGVHMPDTFWLVDAGVN
jgi:peptide/nickel transport system substrate-binding protein